MKSLQKLTKEQLDPYFLEWDRLSVELAALHKQRDRRAKPVLEAALEIYKRLLSHCREALEQPDFEPLNGSDRLSFVEGSPGAYAAYRQLVELFAELKKAVARKRIELKRSLE